YAGARVVVGRDARHGSEAFCTEAAGVLTAAGFDVHVLPSPLPTPVLAFAVRQLKAAAGVQITASHNPPADNGYKVFLADGAQLRSPVDAMVEAAIDAQPGATSIPVAEGWAGVDTSLLEAYLDRVASLPRGTARELRVAVTPMHGVGGESVTEALRRAGFTDVHMVASQAKPDPDFPSVAFPNPEEPGATDALLALAAEVEADLAVALDPDADRCALGVPLPESAGGGWRMLHGDETGELLAEHVLSTLDRTEHPDPLVATTVVSSSMLRRIASVHGARCAVTLTGFKNIARAGRGLIYGYEEALGYCVDPAAVADKDGISAAVLACDLAATLKAAGRSLQDVLDELSIAHGVHLTEGISFDLDRASINALVARLKDELSAELPAPDVLVLREEHDRVVIRPSGTEPKLKTYIEIVEPVPEPTELPAARARAAERMAQAREDVRTLLGL
ncbi:MAG: phospho-sugar mutase, partial [Pseudonocardiales bacterium]|nr:phospho-sugar mutase [Pseudonocardiales bacterium]